jgi:hypothetical protein
MPTVQNWLRRNAHVWNSRAQERFNLNIGDSKMLKLALVACKFSG